MIAQTPTLSSAAMSSSSFLSAADHRAHVDQLGEERMLERPAQERHARRPSGPRLVADDALDGLQVAEAPELEALLDVDQLLAHVVLVPPGLRVVVDDLEHRDQLAVARVWLGEIALDAIGRHRQPAPREMTQEFVVEGWRPQQRFELAERRGVVAEHLERVGVLVAEQELDRA